MSSSVAAARVAASVLCEEASKKEPADWAGHATELHGNGCKTERHGVSRRPSLSATTTNIVVAPVQHTSLASSNKPGKPTQGAAVSYARPGLAQQGVVHAPRNKQRTPTGAGGLPNRPPSNSPRVTSSLPSRKWSLPSRSIPCCGSSQCLSSAAAHFSATGGNLRRGWQCSGPHLMHRAATVCRRASTTVLN